VLLIGANDIGWLSHSAAETIGGIDAIISELHRRLPATRILLVGILPSGRAPEIEVAGQQVNVALAANYAGEQKSYVTFRDISQAFMDDRTLNVSLFTDPLETPPETAALHPTPEGQARMAAALEPTICAMLGDICHQ
jgi:lysophospholipase L1-like esterase